MFQYVINKICVSRLWHKLGTDDVFPPRRKQLLSEIADRETANQRTGSQVFVCLEANQRTSDNVM